MELKETAKMMQSKDYKERFKAEYYQLKIRMDGLEAMLNKWQNGTLEFTPTCSYELLERQLAHMTEYAETLEERASVEEIEL